MSIALRRAVLGSALTTALVGSALAVLPTAATAADEVPAPALHWEISQNFDEGFSLANHTWGDGATENADGVITFPGGTGDHDPATRATTMAYQGSVTSTFNNPQTQAFAYSITIEDPTVEIEADGDGAISAVVTSTVAGAQGQPDDVTTPTRVDLVTFDAAPSGWSNGRYVQHTATPDWAGVLPPDSQAATSLGIQPVDGRAFAPEFLAQLQPSLRAHFFASGSASDATKAPAPFTAETDEVAPTVAAKVTAASYRNGVTIAVGGTGFRGVTNPGDDGVYVGLAPSGGLPEVDDLGDQSSFAVATWVAADTLEDGTFVVSLTAPVSKLDRTKRYSVYTWQAHRHSNTTQDTETPVNIAWSQLRAPSSTTAKLAKAPTPKAAGKVTVKVVGGGKKAAGKVTLTLKKGAKNLRKGKKSLRKGATTWALPKLAKGRYQVVVAYAGSPSHAASRATVKFRVK